MDGSYEYLCNKYIKNAKRRENGNMYGYIKTEKSFDEFIIKLQNLGYKYSTRKSRIYGRAGQVGKDISPFYSNDSDMEAPIEFCGNPFILEYSSHRHCSLGPKYYKKRGGADEELAKECGKKRRYRLISTKKIGCQAKMVIRRVKVFTEYYSDPTDGWSKRAKIIQSLRNALTSSDPPAGLVRYYIEMTPEECHRHPKVATSSQNKRTREGQVTLRTSKRIVRPRLPLSRVKQEDCVTAETQLKVELQDNTFLPISASPSDCDNYVEIDPSTNYIEESVATDTVLVIGNNTEPSPNDVQTISKASDQNSARLSHIITNPCYVQTRCGESRVYNVNTASGELQVQGVRTKPIMCVSYPNDLNLSTSNVDIECNVPTTSFKSEAYDVRNLQANVRSEVERILQSSYRCENKHVMFEVLSILKGCSQVMEDHQLL